MGLLAYDPERVANLKRRLVIAADELRNIRSTDPTAVHAMRSIATIRIDIDQVWLPLITRILDNTALTAAWWYSPVDTGDLRNALVSVMADGYGWSVQRDPLNDDSSVVTLAEARALGSMLSKADLTSLVLDREQVRWLSQQLTIIGRDESLSANFLVNFDSWPTFTYVFGREHGLTGRPDVAGVFDGLMSTWAHTVSPAMLAAGKSATLDSVLPPIEDVDPHVQALMLRALHLDALTTATVAHELLTRWLARKNDPTERLMFDLQVGAGPNAADLLLPLFVNDPVACVWFTQLAAAHPAVLFETSNDPQLTYQVVLVGTDPANTSVTAAGTAVLAILDYFRIDPYTRTDFDSDGHPGEYGPFLGGLVAPWLLQFTMTNTDWNGTAGEKAALLRIALQDERAMEQLIADADRIRAGFNDSLSTYDIDAAIQVGGLLNLLLQLSVNERVDDEIANTDERFNLMWTVVGVASSFLPGGPLLSIATGIAITRLSGKLDEYLDQPDPTGVRRSSERTMDVALALAGADAVTRLHQQWIADGKIAASNAPPPIVNVGGSETWCPSAEYHAEFAEWRNDLPGGRDGALGRQASDLLDAFVGTSEAQSNCAEVAG